MKYFLCALPKIPISEMLPLTAPTHPKQKFPLYVASYDERMTSDSVLPVRTQVTKEREISLSHMHEYEQRSQLEQVQVGEGMVDRPNGGQRRQCFMNVTCEVLSLNSGKAESSGIDRRPFIASFSTHCHVGV